MTHHWEALGWTLIHFCWQAAAIAIVYKLADLAMTTRHSQGRTNARYVLALAALLGMMATSVATLAYEEASHRHVAQRVVSGGATAAQPSLQIIPRPLASIDMPSAPPSPMRLAASDALPYLDAFWLLGVLCLSVRTFGGWWLIHRLRRSALQKAPYTLRIGLDRIRLQMGIPRFVDLRLSSRITGPLTVGIIRPLILLPVTAITSLSPEQIEVVLAHELAHIRRADYFWNILQTMIETLFFFHPAVWWISRRLREQRELCCDDIALSTCQDPAIYATALLRLEEERKMHLHRNRNLDLAMALDGNQSRVSLRARILRILGDPLGESENQSRDLKPLSLTGIIAALVLFLCPLPQVFGSFKAAPKISASIARTVQHAIKPHNVLPAPIAATPSPVPAPAPSPAPQVEAISPMPVPAPVPEPTPVAAAEPAGLSFGMGQGFGAGEGHGSGQSAAHDNADYIDRMRAAGYDVDLDKYVAMKAQDITPEYAAEMAKAGMGKPSADELIALKVQDVTPDYVSKMRAGGYDGDIGQYIAMKVQGITPEYAAEMAKAGFDKPSLNNLIAMKVQGISPDYIAKMRAGGYDGGIDKYIAMKVQGITPEYAAEMAKAGYGKPSVDDLIAMKVQGVSPDYVAKLRANGIEVSSFKEIIPYRIFNVSPEFAAGMKSAGFGSIPQNKLLELRVQGVTPEMAKAAKQQFPEATVDDLVQMRIFNIDADFIASAKRHGFTPLTIQKLVKLRISGILDDQSTRN